MCTLLLCLLTPVADDVPNIKVWRAVRPEDPVTLRVKADLSDYYNFIFSEQQDDWYSVRIADDSGVMHVYAEKNKPLGKEVFAILKDGKRHDLTLTFRVAGDRGAVAQLLKIDKKH